MIMSTTTNTVMDTPIPFENSKAKWLQHAQEYPYRKFEHRNIFQSNHYYNHKSKCLCLGFHC